MLQSCEKKKTSSEIYLRQPHLQPLFVCVSLPGNLFRKNCVKWLKLE